MNLAKNIHRTLLKNSRHATSPLIAKIATSTVNPAEVAHFHKLSQFWWDERGEFAMLHRMNPTRVQFIRERVERTQQDETPEQGLQPGLSGLTALDVGCGGGLLSESLARLGAETLGIDATPSNIEVATAHAMQDQGLRQGADGRYSQHTLRFQHTTTHDLVEEGRTFDMVCAMEVVEHVDNPAAFLRSCAALVRPGGHLFLSTIARTPLGYFLTILMAEKVLGLVTPGTHTYSKYVNPDEMLDFFRTNVRWLPPSPHLPSDVVDIRGIWYNPLSQTWQLSRSGTNLDCNYILWLRRPNE